jgi:acyl transferase domain-containing protein
LRDHKVAGVPLVPGTAYIEMALAAATEFFGVTPSVLRRIQFQKALFMHDEDSRTLQIVLLPTTNARASIRIFSRATDGAWTLHATADAYRDGPNEPPAGDIAAILSRCPEPIASADYYERFRRNGLDYGPTFRGVTEIWRGAGERFTDRSIDAWGRLGSATAIRWRRVPADARRHQSIERHTTARDCGPSRFDRQIFSPR